MPGAGRVGDNATSPADAHGCPTGAHPVIGPAVAGSPDVFVNNMPGVRVGDQGIHAPACGPKTWVAVQGAPRVFINDRPAFRCTDAAQFVSSAGTLIEGSPDVLIGDAGGARRETTVPDEEEDMTFVARFEDTGEPVAGFKYQITMPSGEVVSGQADGSGKSQTVKKKAGRRPRIQFSDQD